MLDDIRLIKTFLKLLALIESNIIIRKGSFQDDTDASQNLANLKILPRKKLRNIFFWSDLDRFKKPKWRIVG